MTANELQLTIENNIKELNQKDWYTKLKNKMYNKPDVEKAIIDTQKEIIEKYKPSTIA